MTHKFHQSIHYALAVSDNNFSFIRNAQWLSENGRHCKPISHTAYGRCQKAIMEHSAPKAIACRPGHGSPRPQYTYSQCHCSLIFLFHLIPRTFKMLSKKGKFSPFSDSTFIYAFLKADSAFGPLSLATDSISLMRFIWFTSLAPASQSIAKMLAPL